MACVIRCSRGQKICCAVTTIVIILLLVTLVVLFLTVFKPKDPIIIIQPVKLERLDSVFFPVIELNVTLGIVATVKNRNHGSFTYQDSTASVNYRGNLVGEAPINGDTVPDHGELNVRTSLTLQVDELLKNKNFLDDFNSGVVNLTSSNTLQGEVKILKLFKKEATSLSNCDISVFIKNKTINSTCQNTLKF
ncbi:late embryogenesis abundant protein At1g64065-like [Prosopis cineraria]|uniref:late embryogenesis abundant protein At1g64065-like n=1 Tax=Prosopis cineraria TaxID=364024 RepID=UPI00240EFF58|nr:late embryogenesis abundant protein At1g64065-like [Prosopis cineraria]